MAEVICESTQIDKVMGAYKSEVEALEGALLIALPYVEDCLTSEDFKKGVVAKHVAIIRAALAKVGMQ